MGRSIGCWVALSLASSHKRVCSVILVSPFTTIRNLVEGMVGKLLSYLIKDRFKNTELISNIKVPCLIIAGLRDKLAPSKMS